MSTNNQQSGEKKYWKNLQELSPTPEFLAEQSKLIRNEFPDDYDRPIQEKSGISRRSFMGLLSASMALAATGCRRPDHKLVPAVKSVEYMVPGVPNFYTTVFSHGNAAVGLLIKSREGRPVKIEGNDMHPASMGSSSAYIQATLLSLYDPDRMRKARVNQGYSTTANAIATIIKGMQEAQAQGKGFRILMGEHASPSLAALVQDVQTALPALKVVTMPDMAPGNAAAANQAAFGIDAEFVPDYSKADVIVSVDCDFLGSNQKHHVYNTRAFTSKRHPAIGHAVMNRLIVAESILSMTGTNADERVRLMPDQYEAFLGAILAGVGGSAGISTPSLSGEAAASAQKIAAELKNGKQGLVVVGSHLSLNAHLLGAAINQAIGAIGADKPINPAHQLPFSNNVMAQQQAFRDDLRNGRIGAVLFIDVNPLYSGDKELRQLLGKLKKEQRFALSQYDDETANECAVYIPLAHYLESWGDALAFDGTLSIQQPMIAPLNEASLSLGDALMQLAGQVNATMFGEAKTYHDYVHGRWSKNWSTSGQTASFDAGWEKSLRDGVLKAGTSAAVSATYNASGAAGAASGSHAMPSRSSNQLYCMLTPSYSVYDGKFANNGWLQEQADPITKITWDNIAAMNRKTAQQLDVKNEDMVRLTSSHGDVVLPVWIQPGMADGVIATQVGYGRTTGGTVLNKVGSNTYELLGPNELVGYTVVNVEKIPGHYPIATTQNHHMLMGREIVKETTFDKIQSGSKELFTPVEVPTKEEGNKFALPLNIMGHFEYKGHRWGMAIDMSSCTGCNACVVACYAENNIPVVGKQQVRNGREMHWIRLDRYYKGNDLNTLDDDVEVVYQPMLCQHCENAPCENVCPVAATTHSPEGLNEMVYNRCVGTRYCLNNCPYKVRRFNYFNFHKNNKSPMEFMYNPDVTVRSRGVMEKCTFCVQRINQAKSIAKDEGRSRVHDGEVVTACQQACPGEAIIFGDTNDPNSRVAKLHKDNRGFLVLEDLDTRPQITYLAKVRNGKSVKA